MYPDDFLQRKLEERRQVGSLRRLSVAAGLTDFCSNDYLGIVRNRRLPTAPELAAGSTGSRLLSGNYPAIEAAEKEIAAFHEAEAALLFNSGYDANIGLLSCVPQKGDTVLYDALCHASIRDGIRLSFARSFSFLHNDTADLQRKLSRATGNVFVVTESVFSMDGDLCPLEELVAITAAAGAHLVIDEAHATGVVGGRGEGLTQSMGLHHRVFARIHTYGKACGCHGAAVAGSNTLRDYLMNFARSFVFTTALPEQAVDHIRASYRLFPGMTEERNRLSQLVHRFSDARLAYRKLHSSTPIQGVLVAGNDEARRLSAALREQGLDVRPILSPTVPKGQERLRIVLHAFNTDTELATLIRALQ